MKIPKSILYCFCLSYLLMACSKTNTDAPAIGKASVTVNKKNYSMNTNTVIYEKRGDTTYFDIDAYTSDSLHALRISFLNVVNVSAGKYFAKLNPKLDSSSISLSYMKYIPGDSGLYWCDTKFHFGSVTITRITNFNIECTFEFEAIEFTDTTKLVKVKGSMSASFLGVGDPSKIKDVPIHKGTMVTNIDGSPTEFTAQTGIVHLGIVKKTIISGNIAKSDQALILEFVDCEPKINGEYIIGQTYSKNGYVAATYTKDKNNIFKANGEFGSSGKIKISKITPSTSKYYPLAIQGTFEFIGFNQRDNSVTTLVNNGIFYAIYKEFE